MSAETSKERRAESPNAAPHAAPDTARMAAAPGEICMIDLGRQEHARVRRLRRGEGSLMRRIVEVTDALKGDGVLEGNAQLVVVLVRERTSPAGLLGAFADDEDDDEDDDDY